MTATRMRIVRGSETSERTESAEMNRRICTLIMRGLSASEAKAQAERGADRGLIR
jgi:hypothetical protein